MPAGKGVKLMDMIAVSWQFWLWMWSSCTEQDSVSNNNSSNNRAELWNYVIVLKEEEILWSTKKWEAESYWMHGIWMREVAEDTKGILFNSQLEGRFERTTHCALWRSQYFPISPESVCMCGDVCQKHFPKLCKALGRAKKCARPEWGQESISLSETPKDL